MVCSGLFLLVLNIPQQTVIQTSVPKEQLSTVYTSLASIGTGIFGVGSVVMGLLADWFGIRAVFVLSGVLLAMVSKIAYDHRGLFGREHRMEE